MMSPPVSPKPLTSPVLFAVRIIVTLRAGSVTNIDDDPFSPVPNCQTTYSLLYDCTNQPMPCGPPDAFHAVASVSFCITMPLLSPMSNLAMSSTVEINPLVGVSVVALYDVREAFFCPSTAYGIASRSRMRLYRSNSDVSTPSAG